ncbi:MAG: SDR family oxidoreductase [Hyphomicrobiales bacterium]
MTKRAVVLVTGASKGIGAATALAFSEAGYDVCVNYQRDGSGAAQTVAKCQANGVRAFAAQADVADKDAVTAMFAKCDDELGPVSCLVNNAGIIGGSTTLADLDEAALSATFATNVFGAVYCLQEALHRMRTDRGGAGGAIITMSSVAATLGSPGEYVHYAASKGALETLTIGAAKELGPLGIRVSAIRVGTTTATDMHAREGNPDRPGVVAAATPLGRIANLGDIAEAALWLASPKAEFVSGTILTVAGGLAP